MRPVLFLFISIFILGCSGGKKRGAGSVIEVGANKVTINNVDLGDWNLSTMLGAIGGTSREIKLNSSSYFIFDDLGLVVYERSSAFKPTERGFADSFNVFFDTSDKDKDRPMNSFTGKLTMDGKVIDKKFKPSDLEVFKSGWSRSTSVGSEKIENTFIKAYFTFSGDQLLYISFALQD